MKPWHWWVGGALAAVPLTAACRAAVEWPTRTSAVAVVVQTAIVLAAALFAKRQLDEARETREAQSRPFVVVDFDVFRDRGIVYLTITNMGTTLARNVRLTFDPGLESSIDDERSTFSKLRILTDGVPTLAPGREIPIVFDFFAVRPDELQDAYTVTVTYDDDRGRPLRDEIALDLGMYRNIEYIDRKTIHDVHGQLKQIVETLHRWNADVGGLLVKTPDDERTEAASRAERREELRRQREEAMQQRQSRPDLDVAEPPSPSS